MLARFRPRLTFANVVSLLALFVALGSGAYAAGVGKDSVGSAQVIDGSLRSIDIGNNRLTRKDLKNASIGREDLAFPLASSAVVENKPVELDEAGTASAAVAQTDLRFARDGKGLSVGSVALRSGSKPAKVSLALVHDGHSHPLGSVSLSAKTSTQSPVTITCNGFRGPNNFSLRVTALEGTVTVGRRSLNVVALPGG